MKKLFLLVVLTALPFLVLPQSMTEARKKTTWEFFTGVANTWYVRPAGGTYGTENGTSYTNAWDGFTNIVWASLLPGDILYICGTHTTQTLTVGTSYIEIRGNYPFDAGVIDVNSLLTECMVINGRNNVIVKNLTVQEATVSCFDVRGASSGIQAIGLIGSISGNQVFQNLNSAQVTYTNCTASGGVDDAISLEGTAIVTANNCSFTLSGTGANAINTAQFTCNDCTFETNTMQVQPDGTSAFTLNRCFITGNLTSNSGAAFNINNCRITNGLLNVITATTCNVTNSYFLGSSSVTCAGTLNMLRTLWNSTTNRTIANSGSGVINLSYTTFRMTSDIYSLRPNAATGTYTVNNCDFVGTGNLGRVVEAARTITLNNCIFNDLNLALVTTGSGVVTTNFCNSFDITTQTSGLNITQNNPVAGNPLLTDVNNDNYTLQTGSVCIDSGLDLGPTLNVGIQSAVWGSAILAPVVTTLNQNGLWDVGSYLFN